jgi:hypothetical protein
MCSVPQVTTVKCKEDRPLKLDSAAPIPLLLLVVGSLVEQFAPEVLQPP